MFYNGNAPSRLNPRIPIKRTNHHTDDVNEDDAAEGDDQDEGAVREDDNSSLWIDPRKTPMDRIQVRRKEKRSCIVLYHLDLVLFLLLPNTYIQNR